MDFTKTLRLLGLSGLVGLLLNCQPHKESINKTETIEPPKKVYSFDNNRGCYQDAIVNGTTVQGLNPLHSHLVMIISRFNSNGTDDSESLASLCTGTLIGPHTVLTAAHCFPKNLISTQIIASINLFCSSGFSKDLVYPASKVSIHPDYHIKESPSLTAPESDVAIVQFEGLLPIDYEPLPLQPIDVKQEMNNTASEMVIVGYGRTQTGVDALPELRYVTRSWDRLVLNKDSLNLVEKLNLVGIDQTDAKGGCSGDSGGPLLVSSSSGYKIMGVASYLEGRSEAKLCEQGRLYYTYLPPYWNWIRQQVP